MDPINLNAIKASADELKAAIPELSADVTTQIAAVDHVLQSFLSGVNALMDRVEGILGGVQLAPPKKG